MSSQSQPRVKAVCVFRNGNRILVTDSVDPAKHDLFYCPLGGGVEFGETSDVCIRREIQEELGAAIENTKLLGVIENLFTYDGQQGHEIVFVYDADFVDRSRYDMARMNIQEGDLLKIAVWLDLSIVGSKTRPLYPAGLFELLKKNPRPVNR